MENTASSPLRWPHRWARQLLALAALAALLGGVFALYGHPDFMVTLANQIWACF